MVRRQKKKGNVTVARLPEKVSFKKTGKVKRKRGHPGREVAGSEARKRLSQKSSKKRELRGKNRSEKVLNWLVGGTRELRRTGKETFGDALPRYAENSKGVCSGPRGKKKKKNKQSSKRRGRREVEETQKKRGKKSFNLMEPGDPSQKENSPNPT